MQTSLYTRAGAPPTVNPIIAAAITELSTAHAALQRAAYGLAFLNDGAPTALSAIADSAADLTRSAIFAHGGPMADAIDLSEAVEYFRDQLTRRELDEMAQRAGRALRLGRPAPEVH